MPKKKPESPWLSGLVINLVSNFVAAVVGVLVTYFSHEGSAWVKPLMLGGAAWLITFCSILALRFMKRLPQRVDPITPENVGRRIRDWLDEFNLTVKSIHDPDADFFYIVTTDGGKKIFISRNIKQFSDYILFKAVIYQNEDDKQRIAEWSDDEKIAARLAVQLELSRAVMGYKTEDMFDELTIFKRIPITATLNAEETFRVMWEVEAMVGSIVSVGAIHLHKHNIDVKTKAENEIRVQNGSGSTKKLRDYNDQPPSRPESGAVLK